MWCCVALFKKLNAIHIVLNIMATLLICVVISPIVILCIIYIYIYWRLINYPLCLRIHIVARMSSFWDVRLIMYVCSRLVDCTCWSNPYFPRLSLKFCHENLLSEMTILWNHSYPGYKSLVRSLSRQPSVVLEILNICSRCLIKGESIELNKCNGHYENAYLHRLSLVALWTFSVVLNQKSNL